MELNWIYRSVCHKLTSLISSAFHSFFFFFLFLKRFLQFYIATFLLNSLSVFKFFNFQELFLVLWLYFYIVDSSCFMFVIPYFNSLWIKVILILKVVPLPLSPWIVFVFSECLIPFVWISHEKLSSNVWWSLVCVFMFKKEALKSWEEALVCVEPFHLIGEPLKGQNL